MGYSGRKKSGKYNSGTKLVVPGQGTLMVKMENGDKIQIKPNNNIIFLPSSTPSSTPPPTPSVTPTNTPTPSVTPTNTPTPSITPTQTPTPSITPTLTPTPTITPTLTPTPTITPTLTPTPTTPPSPFISVWNTSNTTPGSSGSNQVTLPLSSFASTGTIDWGDGNISACTFANRTHTYSSTGIYTITIVSDTCSFNPFNSGGDKFKIIEILQWGCLRFDASFLNGYWFSNCSYLSLTGVTDTPTFGPYINLASMFNSCLDLTYINNSNIWDFSNISSMANMFSNCNSFNDPGLASWDVSNINNMNAMFFNNTSFNQDLSGWCVPLIPSLPSGFDSGATSWVLPKPIWGTCP